MTDTDGLRQQIAAAICPGIYCESHGECLEDADVVLPVVTAWAEQQARQRAAEELRAAAEEGWGPPDQDYIYPEVSDWLHARADALTSEDPASSLGRK